MYGKICFGEGERGNYDASEIAGRKALDHFPLDNWAHHALAHNFEESGRAMQVSLNFIYKVALLKFFLCIIGLTHTML